MKETMKKAYPLFSPWLRVFHWTMVLCVFTLFATGLYIGDPGFRGLMGEEPTTAVASLFSMETIRKIHFSAGFILIMAFILRIYGALRYRGDRLLPKFHERTYWAGLIDTTKHYLLMPEKSEHFVLRNSLARTSYLVVYILFFLEIVTGLAMYAMIRPNSLLALVFNPINLYFSEYTVHIIHHYVAWCFMLFAIVHIYMSFRADVTEKNGEISSMISGVKYYAEDPEDVSDVWPDKETKSDAQVKTAQASSPEGKAASAGTSSAEATGAKPAEAGEGSHGSK